MSNEHTQLDDRAVCEEIFEIADRIFTTRVDDAEVLEFVAAIRTNQQATHGDDQSSSFRDLLRPVIAAKSAMGERDIQYGRFEEMFPKFLQAFDAARATTHSPVAGSARHALDRARYIVIGYGESDNPQAAFVNEREQLLDAVLGMIHTEPSDASDDERAEYRRDIEDDGEWFEGIWNVQFEIGGISIYDLGSAQPTAPSLTTDAGAVLTDGQIIERCKAAGITWHEPQKFVDQDEIDFPGLFDMARMSEMRALLAAHPTEQRGYPYMERPDSVVCASCGLTKRESELLAASADQCMSDVARDVLAERARQVSEEGRTTAHDDRNDLGQMASAAACYALTHRWTRIDSPPPHWPGDWARAWWKPTTPRRDLIKAAALILAEIERIDRAGSAA